MAKPHHLKNAPIREALIDFRVTPKSGLTFEQLQADIEGKFVGYQTKGAIFQQIFAVRMDVEAQSHGTSHDSRKVGLRLHSADERYVAQCQIEGFTLSRLPPYEDWNHLIA